jgi:hypothetical protein
MYSINPTILAASVFVLYFAIVVVALRGYLRTRNIGFVWLGIGVFLWALIFGLVERQRFPINSLNLTLQVIGASLFLVSVISLARARAKAAATQNQNRS